MAGKEYHSDKERNQRMEEAYGQRIEIHNERSLEKIPVIPKSFAFYKAPEQHTSPLKAILIAIPAGTAIGLVATHLLSTTSQPVKMTPEAKHPASHTQQHKKHPEKTGHHLHHHHKITGEHHASMPPEPESWQRTLLTETENPQSVLTLS